MFLTISRLADIMKEKDLAEICVKHPDDLEICLKAKGAVASVPAATPVVTSTSAEDNKPAQPGGNIIKAPIIGTFYAAPAPDKPPFVKVGDRVKKGQVVCIIESMKLMNEVMSEYSGTVAEIYPKDGEAVEFEQNLMSIV